MTPGELNALIKQYNQEEERRQEHEEHEDYRTALICTVIANCHRDPKKRAFQVKDFMPKKVEESKPAKQSPDQMLAMLRAWNAAAGGKEVING